MDAKIDRIVSRLRKRLEILYGPRLVRLVLYGSHARGDADPESDIDVLVVLKGRVNPSQEIHRTSEIVAELSLAEDVVISCVFIEERRADAEKSPFLLNVRSEGVPI